MTMLTQRAIVAAEQEAVEGTAETLVAGDAGFLVFNPNFVPGNAMNQRDPVRTSLSPMVSIPGSRQARMTFDVELVGASAAGTAPKISDLLQACGLGETIVVGTSVTYAPASSDVPSVTIGMWMDGKKYLLWGARGTFTLRMESGMPGMISFDFLGADWSEADEALLAGVTWESVLPPAFLGATLTMDAYTPVISLVEIIMNNTLSLRGDAHKDSGFISAIISNRRPQGRFTVENVTVATYDFLGKWRAGTLVDFDSSFGSAAGNIIAVNAPKVQFHDPPDFGEEDGRSILTMNSLLTLNSGDDEFEIVFT